MSELDLDEIKERTTVVRTWKAVWGAPIPHLCDVDIPALIAEVEKLRGALAIARGMLGDAARQIEEQTADVVSLGGTVDILTARCAQMERDHAETVAEVKRLQAEAIRRKTEFIDVVAEWEKQRNRADAAEEQLRDVEARVHQAFAFADERGVMLDALTVDELTRIVTHAVRGGGAP